MSLFGFFPVAVNSLKPLMLIINSLVYLALVLRAINPGPAQFVSET